MRLLTKEEVRRAYEEKLKRAKEEMARRKLLNYAEFVDDTFMRAKHLELIQGKLEQVERFVETGGKEGIGRLIVSMPPRHCLDGSTLITLSSGERLPISSIRAGDEVFSYNTATYIFEPKPVTNVWSNGVRARIKIVLANGNFIIATGNHRLHTYSGWKQVSDLTIADSLSIPKQLPNRKYKNTFSEDDAVLVAIWIAEGDKRSKSFGVTCGSSLVRDRVKSIAASRNWLVREDDLHIRLTCDKPRSENSPVNWMRKVGIATRSTTTHTVRIPKWILESDNKIISSVLSYLWATDGWFGRESRLAGYTTASLDLAYDVQTLLLSLGIQSRVKNKHVLYKGEKRLFYDTLIHASSLQIFNKLISVPNKPPLEAFTNFTEDFPPEWRKELILSPSTHRYRWNNRIDKPGWTSSEKVGKSADLENNSTLIQRVSGDVRWSKIVSIEMLEPAEVFDIEIADNHSFIANGIISHNSKSVTITTKWPQFMLGKHPDWRFIIVAYSQDLANDFSRTTRDTLMHNHEYSLLFPDVLVNSDSAAVERWQILGSNDPSMIAVGAGGPIVGRGGHIIIIDDLVKNRTEAESPTFRENNKRFYAGTLRTRLEPNGAIILVNCLTGDTPVTLSDGSWKRIDKLTVGEFVLTWNNGITESKRILHMKKQPKAVIYELKTGHHTIRGNGKHPILVKIDSDYEWKKLRDVVEGDKVVSAAIRQNIDYVEKILTQDEAWLLGYMFGDGWITRHPNKDYGSMRWATCVAKGIYEDRNERVLVLFEKIFGKRPKLTKSGYYRFEVADVGRWFENKGLIGNAHTKRIPPYVFSQSFNVRKAFLDGFINADGYINPANRVIIGLCNRDLVCDVKYLAEGAGYAVSNIHKNVHKNNAPNSVDKDKTAYTYFIAFQYSSNNNSCFVTETVRSVKKLPDKEHVYDIEVADNHNFFANNIVTHNTRWHEDDLIGNLIEQEKIGGEKWDYVNLPAFADSENDPLGRLIGEPLWPERFPRKTLLELKQGTSLGGMATYEWDSQYQGHPKPPGGSKIQTELFKYVDAAPEGLDWKRYWDLALSTKDAASYTASCRGAFDKDLNFYIADMMRLKDEWPDVEEAIKKTFEKELNVEQGIEEKLHGLAVITQFRRDIRLARSKFRGIKVDTSKLDRALPWISRLESGKVFLVRGKQDTTEGAWIGPFLEEARNFTGINDQWSDQIDSVSGAYSMLANPKWRKTKFKKV